MAKKLITLKIEQKMVKVNFSDIRKVYSKKPKRVPILPQYLKTESK